VTNFGFLQLEWPQLFTEGQKAEALVIPDPRTACFYARRTLELAEQWLISGDAQSCGERAPHAGRSVDVFSGWLRFSPVWCSFGHTSILGAL
jgi:hypothetical protein